MINSYFFVSLSLYHFVNIQNSITKQDDGIEINETEIAEGTKHRKRVSLTPEKSSSKRPESVRQWDTQNRDWVSYRNRARRNGEAPITIEEWRALNIHPDDRSDQVRISEVSFKIIYEIRQCRFSLFSSNHRTS